MASLAFAGGAGALSGGPMAALPRLRQAGSAGRGPLSMCGIIF